MPKNKKSSPAPKKKKNNINLIVLLILAIVALIGIFTLKKVAIQEPDKLQNQGFDFSEKNGDFVPGEKKAYFEGQEIKALDAFPEYLGSAKDETNVLGDSNAAERWIEVDLSEQKIIAHEGDEIFLEAPISSGLDRSPTPSGEFTIWYKTKSQKMSGGEGRDYYYLPNVPYIMFFENEQVSGYKGYSLHGAYWHNDWGNQRSHGCVNLPIPIAEKLYYWTQPTTPEGKNIIRSTEDNPGTRIVIHE